MWSRVLRLGGRCRVSNVRSFLSAAYSCEEQWVARREAWALRTVKPNELYQMLDQKVNREEPLSPVDVDVFVNSATVDHLMETRDLLHKMRVMAHTHLTSPSTHYATVKMYSEVESFDELFQILDDRLNYGVFLDRFSANILFDRLLRREDFESAARIAALLMLQENFEGPITENFAFYSTYKYLKSPLPPKPADEPVNTIAKKKKVEEIKIRVGFLRNPFFDDHFDIVNRRHLAGKTMVALSKRSSAECAQECLFWGWLFYEKYDKAKNVAEKLVKRGKIYRETLQRIDDIIEKFQEKNTDGLTAVMDIKAIVQNIPIIEGSMNDEILKNLQNSITEHEKNEIDQHSELLSLWVRQRDEQLKEQLEKLEESKKEAMRIEREEKLKELDQKLWFFDNQEAVDLAIETRNASEFHPKRYFGKKKKPKTDTIEYVPPEIVKRRK